MLLHVKKVILFCNMHKHQITMVLPKNVQTNIFSKMAIQLIKGLRKKKNKFLASLAGLSTSIPS